MKNRLISLILMIILLISPQNILAEELSLYAKGAVLIDAKTGRTLYGKNENEHMSMASTTKIMTCIIALEYGDLDKVALVSENAVNRPKVRLGVKEDEQYILKDLLYAMMLESYNDVAVVVAEAVAGSEENFLELMNKKAKEIGANNTNFGTVNGLDIEGHYSTAYDMALIGSYAIKNEKFLEIINTKQYQFLELSTNRAISVSNKNSYLSINENAIGIKTGFTNSAGYCFVGATEYEDRTFVSCVLQCGWPPNSKYKWNDTATLMNYGKENYQNKIVYDASELIIIDLEKGSQTTVKGKLKNNLEALVCNNDEINMVVEEKITLPIQKGDEIGKLKLWINDTLVFEEKIYSTENVEKNKFIYNFKRIFSWFFDE